MSSMILVALTSIALAATVMVSPAATAHESGCASSLHAGDVHAHVLCGESEPGPCFVNGKFQNVKLVGACADLGADPCLLRVHAVLMLRLCSL